MQQLLLMLTLLVLLSSSRQRGLRATADGGEEDGVPSLEGIFLPASRRRSTSWGVDRMLASLTMATISSSRRDWNLKHLPVR